MFTLVSCLWIRLDSGGAWLWLHLGQGCVRPTHAWLGPVLDQVDLVLTWTVQCLNKAFAWLGLDLDCHSALGLGRWFLFICSIWFSWQCSVYVISNKCRCRQEYWFDLVYYRHCNSCQAVKGKTNGSTQPFKLFLHCLCFVVTAQVTAAELALSPQAWVPATDSPQSMLWFIETMIVICDWGRSWLLQHSNAAMKLGSCICSAFLKLSVRGSWGTIIQVQTLWPIFELSLALHFFLCDGERGQAAGCRAVGLLWECRRPWVLQSLPGLL